MKSKMILMIVARISIGVIFIVLIWIPLAFFAFNFAVGQDPGYDLGSSYELWYRPPWGSSGGILYWPSKEDPFEHVISQPVLEFAISGPWIIGRTEKGWFSINKELHDVNYPQSKSQLLKTTGLDISTLKMETDPTPYLIGRSKGLAAKARVDRLCWILIFIVPAALGFGPLIIRKFCRTSPSREN